jgi:outer membrane protein OmpA-like peptidoglycan-associated protein
LEPIVRAKKVFFACLGTSVAILLLVDFYLGPAAFAVPPPANPTTTAPAASASSEQTSAPSPTPSASVTASASAEPTSEPEPEPVAEPKTATQLPKYTGGKMSGVVATFEFEEAKADLAALQALAKEMHADPSAEIVLEGHSDPSGNEYRNLTLSLDRANWAADRLVEYGINRMRIRTVGLGSARPIVDIGGDAGAVNRRVEVRWVARAADGGGR